MPARRARRATALRPVPVLAAVVVALLGAVLPGALPAAADPKNPTPAELQAAHRQVEAAQSAVSGLQARAEAAAEAYLGARTLADRAAAASTAARAQAGTARAAYAAAATRADEARTAAALAQADVAAAEATDRQARAEVAAAQRRLTGIAIGAFQSGGQVGMVAHLFVANDPLELANGRNLMNQVGAYQQRVVLEVRDARDRAALAATQAQTARARAVTAQQQAADALAAIATSKAAAEAADRAAADAAREARATLHQAARAKEHAQVLVVRAEQALGSAKVTAAGLERAAAAARRAAASVHPTGAPSNAAATAMHWALEEIGVPYSWGGGDENGPTRGFAQGANTVGFDCSGLMLFAYAKAGIHLDHWTGSQWHAGQRISSMRDVRPGDLLFFAYDTSDDSTIHHVGMYLGDGKMVEAPYTGEVVRVASAHRSDFIGATRPWA